MSRAAPISPTIGSIMTTTTKPLTPLMTARAERDAAKAELAMYRHLHQIKERGDIPDVVVRWSGADLYAETDRFYAYRVEIRWWASCRGDEGYVEIVEQDLYAEHTSCAVIGAMDLRERCREGRYSPPWRYEVGSMLAMSLVQREESMRTRRDRRMALAGERGCHLRDVHNV